MIKVGFVIDRLVQAEIWLLDVAAKAKRAQEAKEQAALKASLQGKKGPLNMYVLKAVGLVLTALTDFGLTAEGRALKSPASSVVPSTVTLAAPFQPCPMLRAMCLLIARRIRMPTQGWLL